MKKIIFSITFITFITAITIILLSKPKTPTATIRNQSFAVEIADDAAETQQGLSGRTSLGEKNGMLFLFKEKQQLSFWMPDMHFPIDIIFINDGKIVTLYDDVPFPDPSTPKSDLPRYKSSEMADTVLEIKGGLAKKYGFQVGDTVKLQNIH